MKKLSILLLALFVAPLLSRADEGMWLISLVQTYNYEKMHALGCKIPAGKIYNESQPSLKDAIVSFGGYCTAEFVSKDGLLFTNHHCGYESIASLSTVGANYLDKGYWAKTHADEIPVPGLFVRVLVRMSEVTDSILPKVNGLTGNERAQKITELTQSLARNADPNKKYKVEVKPFYAGNQYFLFVYQEYDDVRFVGAPPSSIGKFGGDTDNWMWPRHTGDFSVFRVYANGSNEPVAFNKDSNVPFHPKYALNVSLASLKEGDYAMVIGYPGSTDRYQTRYGLQYVNDVYNPTLISIFKSITDAMKTGMDKDEATKLKLAANYANYMNTLKLFQGQLDAFKRTNPAEIKKSEETDFISYINTLPAAEKEQYANVLRDIEDAYKQLHELAPALFFPFEISSLPSSAKVSMSLAGMQENLKRKMPADSMKMMMDAAKADLKDDLGAINKDVETDMLASLLKAYNRNVPADKQAQTLKKITGGDKNADAKIDAAVKKMMDNSFVTDAQKLDAFMKIHQQKKLRRTR